MVSASRACTRERPVAEKLTDVCTDTGRSRTCMYLAPSNGKSSPIACAQDIDRRHPQRKYIKRR